MLYLMLIAVSTPLALLTVPMSDKNSLLLRQVRFLQQYDLRVFSVDDIINLRSSRSVYYTSRIIGQNGQAHFFHPLILRKYISSAAAFSSTVTFFFLNISINSSAVLCSSLASFPRIALNSSSILKHWLLGLPSVACCRFPFVVSSSRLLSPALLCTHSLSSRVSCLLCRFCLVDCLHIFIAFRMVDGNILCNSSTGNLHTGSTDFPPTHRAEL